MVVGQGWSGDSEGHRRAGKKGGLRTRTTHGSEHYRKIGKKGGDSRNKDKVGFFKMPKEIVITMVRMNGKVVGKVMGEKDIVVRKGDIITIDADGVKVQQKVK